MVSAEPGLANCSMRRRQMRGLAHDGEVHVQIVADGTDDDLARIEPRRGSPPRTP